MKGRSEKARTGNEHHAEEERYKLFVCHLGAPRKRKHENKSCRIPPSICFSRLLMTA